MLRIVTAALLALTVAQHASAAPLPVYTGVGDGQAYRYTAEMVENGNLRLVGTILDSRQDFVLLVRPDGHVTGTFGYSPVSFVVPKAARDRAVSGLQMEAADRTEGSLNTASR